jgi:hypothetical protein
MWTLVRLMVAFLAPGQPAWPTRILVIACTAFLVWWDRRRSHELLLHANLGASPGWFWAASLLTATVLDGALQTLLSVL